MKQEQIEKILEEHKAWLNRTGGAKADLYGADLCGADLCGADLCDADLRDAHLCGADLCDADLRDAYLYGANLRDADLRGADLRDAHLCGADLRGADLRGANLRGVRYNEQTAYYAMPGKRGVYRIQKGRRKNSRAGNTGGCKAILSNNKKV